MAFRLLLTSAALLACASTAFAQDKPAAKPPAAAPAQASNATPNLSGPQPDWVKVCSTDPQNKREVCQVSRDLRAETGQTLASVAVREIKGGKRALVLAIPPGMQIQPGVRVVVDKQPAILGKFSVCMQNACFIEAEMTDAILSNFKKGTTLNLQALNVQGRGVTLPISLAGFGKAYDGAALDPKVLAQDQERLKQQLIERAKKAQAEAAQPPAQ
jgi:invasion protein IalB